MVGEKASRIGRFYVPAIWVVRVQGIETRVPFHYSDHQEVVLYLRGAGRPCLHFGHERVTYPMNYTHSDRVITELVDETDAVAIGQVFEPTS